MAESNENRHSTGSHENDQSLEVYESGQVEDADVLIVQESGHETVNGRVGLWTREWLTFLYEEYVLKHHKTLSQVINIIVNFDECTFYYTSLRNSPYLRVGQEIRRRKRTFARITGLFGATMSGHKFKPLIIGKSARPFSTFINGVDDLPVYYTHNKKAWMTADIFREWFLTCFLLEISPFIDNNMQVQFLIDNSSAHTSIHIDQQLWTRRETAGTVATSNCCFI